jgi:hypothetical protein
MQLLKLCISKIIGMSATSLHTTTLKHDTQERFEMVEPEYRCRQAKNRAPFREICKVHWSECGKSANLPSFPPPLDQMDLLNRFAWLQKLAHLVVQVL